VTIYPSDEEQPRYTTASAADGNIVANAAIIRARSTDGAINLYSTDTTDVLIDIAVTSRTTVPFPIWCTIP
jgi:hypothetical protein